jgi:hypothetical protein
LRNIVDDNQDNNETTSGDAKQKTYFVCNVESAVLVSALNGKMVGNVLKSYMGAFMSAEIFAEILKKAGHIVRMGGGKFANRTGPKSPPSR